MGSRLESGSNAVRKRIENHVFDNEDGEEYQGSSFGGFGDYFRRKKLKLQNLDAELRASSPQNPPIFRGVVAHVNGYTQPSLKDLHHLIVSHGGGFLQYLDGKTSATHIIASTLTPKKREEFRKYRIVKPAWVVESVKAGRILPWDSFRVVDEGQSQKVLMFAGNGQVQSQVNTQSRSYKDQTDTSWYTSQLKSKSLHNDDHMEITSATSSAHGMDAGAPVSIPNNELQETHYGAEMAASPALGTTLDTSAVDPGIARSGSRENSGDLEPPDDTQGADQVALPEPVSDKSKESDAHSSMTPEEYNAQLLSAPHMRNSSVVNPEFIQQFYRESRLHHLSTWKAELKAKLQSATQEKGSARRANKPNVPGARRYILHVDFDSFFAAVSIQKHPELADQPVAIAHGTGPGSEIASCNYPARSFGIKNGMWMKGALQMCPNLKVLPYDFHAYEQASRKFYEVIMSVDGIVQSVSIDEALLDITGVCIDAGGSDGRGTLEGAIYREQEKADEIAQKLRDSVKEQTGCNISVGIGGNVLQARVALRKAKPAGQFQLKPEEVLDFMGTLAVKDLPGVAHSLGAKLEELGVTFVKDIRELSREKLTSSLGPKTGAKLWNFARGIDNTEVGVQAPRKSVSAEINWGIRFVNQAQAEEFVQSLCDELHRRLVENLVKGKQLTMRIMKRSADAPLEPVKHLGHGRCDTFNKSINLGVATNASDIIGREAISILRSFKFSPGDLRGLGVQMTKLEPVKQNNPKELDSSQRQISFKPASPTRQRETPIDPDEISTPRKGDTTSEYLPKSLQSAPALTDISQKPLNLTGTQFVMPTQVDPKVLAELPMDIRSKFAHKQAHIQGTQFQGESPRADSLSAAAHLPPQSQLDPDMLAELPEDVRAEVLGYYKPPLSPRSESTQLGTPRRNKPAISKAIKKAVTPTKARAGRARGRPNKKLAGNNSTLMQSNFILARPSTDPTSVQADVASPASPQAEADGISDEFLAALPDDIRREVLEEHKRSRLQKRAGLNLPPPTRRSLFSRPTARLPEQKTITLLPRPEKPTFTSKKLSSLPELRKALDEWYETFEMEAPYEEDVAALAKYLKRVVLEEKDIAKAVAVVGWLAWLIGSSTAEGIPLDQGGSSPEVGTSSTVENVQAREGWVKALWSLRDDISDAVQERGLPPVEFT
ncbi:DNA repair protein REV1 [Blastomyces parvus]|uniref:DNA repair protein REV1 n=1 Tax=Blastomyces parvus TaxID=2060905 RepID=A0A2B7X8T5_9EURO|nr:DNA repair protein REV1 [Blastomyces parvus]